MKRKPWKDKTGKGKALQNAIGRLARKGAALAAGGPGPQQEPGKPPERQAVDAIEGKAKEATGLALEQGKKALKKAVKEGFNHVAPPGNMPVQDPPGPFMDASLWEKPEAAASRKDAVRTAGNSPGDAPPPALPAAPAAGRGALEGSPPVSRLETDSGVRQAVEAPLQAWDTRLDRLDPDLSALEDAAPMGQAVSPQPPMTQIQREPPILHSRRGEPVIAAPPDALVRWNEPDLLFRSGQAAEIQTYQRYVEQMQAAEQPETASASPGQTPVKAAGRPCCPSNPKEKTADTGPWEESSRGFFTAQNPSEEAPSPAPGAGGKTGRRNAANSPHSLRAKPSGDAPLSIKQGEGLRTWANDPAANSLRTQTAGAALHTSGHAVQSGAQAGMQAGGQTIAQAAGGAATGGASAAVQAVKKAADKFGEMIEDAARSGRQRAGKSLGPLAACLFLPLFFLLFLGGLGGGGFAVNVGLSQAVLDLMPQISAACQENGIPAYTALAAAVVMQESMGDMEWVHGDVMQCAEGMGYPVGTPVPVEESLRFGTGLLAANLRQAGSTGPTDLPAISLALQGYNFGNGYISWAMARGGHSKENAREFSRWQAGLHNWNSYGDVDYVDHVLRFYQISAGSGAAGDPSVILGGFFAYPSDTKSWVTYAGHEGIDIQAGYGEPVYACAAGTVSYAQGAWTEAMGRGGVASYGNCVFIDHGNGWQSRYAHMSSIAVASGAVVQPGQVIGYVGNTGNSFGAHLHLALYCGGSPSSGGVIYAEQAWPQFKR